jgi:hypothetical protein
MALYHIEGHLHLSRDIKAKTRTWTEGKVISNTTPQCRHLKRISILCRVNFTTNRIPVSLTCNKLHNRTGNTKKHHNCRHRAQIPTYYSYSVSNLNPKYALILRLSPKHARYAQLLRREACSMCTEFNELLYTSDGQGPRSNSTHFTTKKTPIRQ